LNREADVLLPVDALLMRFQASVANAMETVALFSAAVPLPVGLALLAILLADMRTALL
jgi:hypothetical protein